MRTRRIAGSPGSSSTPCPNASSSHRVSSARRMAAIPRDRLASLPALRRYRLAISYLRAASCSGDGRRLTIGQIGSATPPATHRATGFFTFVKLFSFILDHLTVDKREDLTLLYFVICQTVVAATGTQPRGLRLSTACLTPSIGMQMAKSRFDDGPDGALQSVLPGAERASDATWHNARPMHRSSQRLPSALATLAYSEIQQINRR
jgi:hypothetical protein